VNIQIIHWHDGKVQLRLIREGSLVASIVGCDTAAALLLLTKVFDDDFID
jgi:hypothetical protein